MLMIYILLIVYELCSSQSSLASHDMSSHNQDQFDQHLDSVQDQFDQHLDTVQFSQLASDLHQNETELPSSRFGLAISKNRKVQNMFSVKICN